jgi:hypothetical protein
LLEYQRKYQRQRSVNFFDPAETWLAYTPADGSEMVDASVRSEMALARYASNQKWVSALQYP